jgi:hypothetical protein
MTPAPSVPANTLLPDAMREVTHVSVNPDTDQVLALSRETYRPPRGVPVNTEVPDVTIALTSPPYGGTPPEAGTQVTPLLEEA